MSPPHPTSNPLDLAFYQALFSSIDVGLSIFRVDDLDDPNSTRWITSNSKAAHILNLDVEPYLGRKLVDSFPGMRDSNRLHDYAAVARSGHKRDLGDVISAATAYTATRVYAVSAFPLPDQCVGVMFEDVTDQRRSTQEVVRHADRLRLLADISKEFAAVTTDYVQLLQTIAQRAATILRDWCVIRLVSDDGQYLEPMAVYAPDPQVNALVLSMVTQSKLRVDEGPPGQVMTTGQPLFIPAADPETLAAIVKPEILPILQKIGGHTGIIVPLQAHGRSIGLLYLTRYDPDLPPYDEDDLRLAEDLAERAALAIENARLLNELEAHVLERTRQLAQVNQDLEAALAEQKLINELKSRFVSMITHDFRTPLAVILSSSDLLRRYRDRLSADAQLAKLDVIQSQVQYLSSLVESVLFVNRAENRGIELKPVAFDLDQLCRQVLDDLAIVTDYQQQIVLRRFGECRLVVSDKVLIQQILLNLLSNAIKYSPPQSAVTLAISCQEQALTLQVRDQGIGIPEPDLQNLFTLFYRASNAHHAHGIGVGLVVVKEAVSALKGSVMVESEVNKGTSFTVVIPQMEAV